jgi:hypothetical protein
MKTIHVDENQSFYRRQFNCMQLDDVKEQIPTKKGTKSISKSTIFPFLILGFQQDGKKTSLQQLLIHARKI